jgi:hypothetical protein
VALYELVIWLVYFRSIYSASGFPGDLQFVLHNLNSVRYVEGALLVAEAFLVALLLRRGLPAAFVYVLLAAQGLSRLWLVLRRDPDVPWLAALLLAVGLASLFAATRFRWRVAIASTLLVGGLACGVWRIQSLRPQWLDRFRPLYAPLYDARPQRIFFVIDDPTGQQPCGHFAFMGRRLQHDVVTGDWSELPATNPPRYVAWLRNQSGEPARELPGYTVRVDAPAGVLYVARVIRSAL